MSFFGKVRSRKEPHVRKLSSFLFFLFAPRLCVCLLSSFFLVLSLSCLFLSGECERERGWGDDERGLGVRGYCKG
jgi:hypothetical protein